MVSIPELSETGVPATSLLHRLRLRRLYSRHTTGRLQGGNRYQPAWVRSRCGGLAAHERQRDARRSGSEISARFPGLNSRGRFGPNPALAPGVLWAHCLSGASVSLEEPDSVAGNTGAILPVLPAEPARLRRLVERCGFEILATESNQASSVMSTPAGKVDERIFLLLRSKVYNANFENSGRLA
jgi:hypothetical protein